MNSIRGDFPTIRRNMGIYLDNACQSLRPDSVIKAMNDYYNDYPACGGRSFHSMANKVSVSIDETRETLASFFNTKDPNCYIFTKNCTESLNNAAYGVGLQKGDIVVTTDMEHNSNHVPWIFLQNNVGIHRRMSKSSIDGEFDIESFKQCMDHKVKVVSLYHCNNVTGCTIPIKAVAEIAHDFGAIVIVDGAQAAPHMSVDLSDLDVDLYCVSIHKMLGPSGMGIMYGKHEILKNMRPLIFGGGAVSLATYEEARLLSIPDKFEAGLQNYSGIVGTKAALDYLMNIGMDEIEKWDIKLVSRIISELKDISNIHIIGPTDPKRHSSIFSFNIDGLNAYDIAIMVDNIANIMIRSGMHCMHPFYVSRGINGSARASVYFYNDVTEINKFINTVCEISNTFGE